MTDRLDARLVAAGAGPRKEIQQAIRKGRVTVDGVTIKKPGDRTDGDVALDGTVFRAPPISLIMHKPAGYSCSHQLNEAPLIYELLPAHWPTFQTIGRLDRDTTGLLILTRDGQLNHHITSPKHEVTKEYHLTYEGTLKPTAVAKFEKGVALDDGPCRPAKLDLPEEHKAIVTLTEGRFHQVKRMIQAVNGRVTNLHRHRIGGLILPTDLTAGDWREIQKDELAALDEARPLNFDKTDKVANSAK